MATTPEPLETAKPKSMYFVEDSGAELARLVEQERAFAKALGGLLPEHADEAAFVAPFHRVLDVACGSGAWLLEMAQTYPHLEVMGFDIDARMINYANTQAHVGRLDNASFRVMDARKPLDYPDAFFDLVNARWISVIGTAAWPSTVVEDHRALLKLIQPYLIKMGVTTQEEVDQLYREAEIEMLADDFCALWYLFTIWAEKPSISNFGPSQ